MTQEVVQFVDEVKQEEVNVSVSRDSLDKIGETSDTSLGSWLERPLEIANISWTTGGTVNEILDPWDLFLSDPRNINKIAYFNNMKCDGLCVKFLLNGGPFFYGRLMASYLPFDSYSNSIVRDNTSFYTGTAPTIPECLNTHSHRPHLLIDPSTSQGGCFQLPFLWPYNWISIPTSEWQHLGKLSLQSFGDLGTAGGITSATIKIKVFAWLVNPRLSAPTTSLPTLPAQSTAGDEYVGMFSKPASAVARVAGKLTEMPVIGSYARATQMGAGAMASIAKLFGFSRPTMIGPLDVVRPTFVADIATVDKPEYVFKITTDSKQELSISPDICGLSTEDPFSIAGLVGRETYLGSASWLVSATEGTNLFSSLVTPMLYKTYIPPTYTLNASLLNTAMSYGAFPFRYWKGNIKFRFQLIASQYHRGRVKIVYDIAAAPISTKTNALYSRIIDITEMTDFVVTIGWNSPRIMLEMMHNGELVENWASNGLAFAPSADYHNGSLSMFVENELMVPIPGISADVQWLVWVSMENPVFNEPTGAIDRFTPNAPFVATSGEEVMTESFNIGDMSQDPNINQVVFGETITSFRALLKRYTNYLYCDGAAASTSLKNFWHITIRDYPLYPGKDSAGINTTSTAVATNFVYMTLINYLGMAHSMYRGGIKWKSLLINGNQYVTSLEFDRYPGKTASTNLLSSAYSTAGSSITPYEYRQFVSSSILGKVLTIAPGNNFLEVEAPFWYPERFLSPKNLRTNGVTSNAVRFSLPHFNGGTVRVQMSLYCAAAEDFQLYMYTGPPQLWLSSYNVYA